MGANEDISLSQRLRLMESEIDGLRGQLSDLKNENEDLRNAPPVTESYVEDSVYGGEAENGHSWHFEQTGDAAITITAGAIYVGGVAKTPASWTSFPTALAVTITGTGTTYFYITVEIATAAVTYVKATSDPGNGDADTEYWILGEVAHTSSVITSIKERCQSDIHITKFA